MYTFKNISVILCLQLKLFYHKIVQKINAWKCLLGEYLCEKPWLTWRESWTLETSKLFLNLHITRIVLTVFNMPFRLIFCVHRVSPTQAFSAKRFWKQSQQIPWKSQEISSNQENPFFYAAANNLCVDLENW